MANNKKRILLVGEKRRVVYQRVPSILSKKFTVKEWYILPDPDKPTFFVLRWFSIINNWDKMIRKFKPDKIIICGGALISIWLIVFLARLFRLNIEITLFRYDIEHFRPSQKGFKENFRFFVALKLEKFCFLNSDKIIHKGLENELEFLSFYKKIKHKPHYLFRNFLDYDLIQKYNPNKLSKKDGEIHLVFVGGPVLNDMPHTESFLDFYPKITKQKIHLHLYFLVPENIEEKFKEIGKRDPFFHYETVLEHHKLIKEISKYDYGYVLHGTNKKLFGNASIWLKTIFGNKYYDYISAFLPIICSDNLEATVRFIKKNKIGFSIHYDNISNLRKEILKNKKNYIGFVKNIKKFIKDKKNYDHFIEFINNESR